MKGNTSAEAAGPAFHTTEYNAETNTLCGMCAAVVVPGFECGACPSEKFISRGEVRDAQRFECLDCGAIVDVIDRGDDA